jgi:hypothetical protein
MNASSTMTRNTMTRNQPAMSAADRPTLSELTDARQGTADLCIRLA